MKAIQLLSKLIGKIEPQVAPNVINLIQDGHMVYTVEIGMDYHATFILHKDDVEALTNEVMSLDWKDKVREEHKDLMDDIVSLRDALTDEFKERVGEPMYRVLVEQERHMTNYAKVLRTRLYMVGEEL